MDSGPRFDGARPDLRRRRSGNRHLVYLSRDYAVDVQLRPGGREPAVLYGELLSRGDGPIAEVPTFLLDGDKIAGYARTGSAGEFRLETGDAADLRLCLLLGAERCIDLPIAAHPDVRTTSGG